MNEWCAAKDSDRGAPPLWEMQEEGHDHMHHS